MKPKIFISTFPFCRTDDTPRRLLAEAGCEIIENTKGRKLKPAELALLAKDCKGVVAGTEDLRDLVRESGTLKIIARVGVGLDNVPFDLCREKNIKVAYTPNAVTPAVAELTIGLMLNITRQVSMADREIRMGGWSRPYGQRLGASTIGIIGFGRIGKSVAKLLASFQPKKILIHDKIDLQATLAEWNKDRPSIQQVDLPQLLRESDIVSLHLPRTSSTLNFISRAELSSMKKSAYLVNTARGGIVNEQDLLHCLNDAIIAGAAVDVFEEEPYTGPLIRNSRVLLTQHMGSCAEDSRADMEREACEDIVRFLQDKPIKSEAPWE